MSRLNTAEPLNEYLELQKLLESAGTQLELLRAQSDLLIDEIYRIDSDLRIFKQKAFLNREPKDTEWYEKATFALIKRKAALRSNQDKVSSLKAEAKNARHSYELHVREGFLAAFNREAKKLLSTKDYNRIFSAAKTSARPTDGKPEGAASA